jgi:23S rRNA pseudouridine2604 synthase
MAATFPEGFGRAVLAWTLIKHMTTLKLPARDPSDQDETSSQDAPPRRRPLRAATGAGIKKLPSVAQAQNRESNFRDRPRHHSSAPAADAQRHRERDREPQRSRPFSQAPDRFQPRRSDGPPARGQNSASPSFNKSHATGRDAPRPFEKRSAPYASSGARCPDSPPSRDSFERPSRPHRDFERSSEASSRSFNKGPGAGRDAPRHFENRSTPYSAQGPRHSDAPSSRDSFERHPRPGRDFQASSESSSRPFNKGPSAGRDAPRHFENRSAPYSAQGPRHSDAPSSRDSFERHPNPRLGRDFQASSESSSRPFNKDPGAGTDGPRHFENRSAPSSSPLAKRSAPAPYRDTFARHPNPKSASGFETSFDDELDTSGIRLSKRMGELGMSSRREADDWIAKGWVRVDGRVVSTLGARIQPDQEITLDPRARSEQAGRITVLLNKPVGYVSGQAEDGYEPAKVLIKSQNHWHDDACKQIMHPGQNHFLVPAGRLDIDSVGLLVLTQDGRVAKKLIGADNNIEKEYLVRVESLTGEPLSSEALALLNHGLSLDEQPLRPALVEWVNEDQLRFVLKEGKKRQIRRMCEAVGLQVTGLKRVRIGKIKLGDLPAGQWRYLGEDEVF